MNPCRRDIDGLADLAAMIAVWRYGRDVPEAVAWGLLLRWGARR